MSLFLKILPKCRSVLCLDGALPYGRIRQIGLPILAADGAANRLIRHGLEPEIILGDLDSVDPDLLPGRRFLKIPDQDTGDFEKALLLAERESLAPVAVTGLGGGDLDHIWGNFGILSRTHACFFSQNLVGMMIDKIFRSDILPLHTKISLFGAPQCTMRSRGLRWELEGRVLSVGGAMSLGNRTCCPSIELQVLSGKAMVLIHTEDVRDAGYAGA